MEYYDKLERRNPQERETALFSALPNHINFVKNNAPGWAKLLSEIDPVEISSRETLATLPIIRKSELTARQTKNPPFGGLSSAQYGELSWVFCSPGPIFEPGKKRGDFWRMGRALHAAGFRKGDLVHNTFAYHLTPAGHMMEAGAHACGCTVIPAGIGNTEQQVEVISKVRPTKYVGTPSFLRILLEKAGSMDLDVSSITHGAVGGEALPPSLRKYFQQKDIQVLQSYGTADIGLIAYESSAIDGMIVDEDIILEIVRPGTGTPVPEGEVGEIVVTSLNPDYPLIRFATGDLSTLLPGLSPCGRTNSRIKGWMGRADQTTKVKGMFIHPKQIAQVVERHVEISRARLVVDNQDHVDFMTLHCEVPQPSEDLKSEIAKSLQAICKIKGEVILEQLESLQNDGKVIDDVRTYA
ncbi:MAG: AMP-dependent synthetase [Rhodospirillaceae bacterium]|nr:AMP-dependent synthetase [Rhodospirillaceae bacterium]